MIVSVQVNEYYNNGATSSHPGFWEIPVNSLYDEQSGFPCVYVDACKPPTETEAVDYLWSNFENTFIDRLLALDDVYIVSAKQVLDWMRTPYNVTKKQRTDQKGWD
nr:hypothetical protein BaRGS_010812 [Batillaria attramentaria]